MSQSYALSAWIFVRALSAVYLIAFLSLAVQARGLWGSRGVLPIASYMQAVRESTDATRLLQVPSVFWASSSDFVVSALAWVGVLLALAALAGFAQGWMLLACFALYLSYCNSGQEFMSFQWDALLLEAGFLTLFIVPWSLRWEPWIAHQAHWIFRGLFCLLLFKLMFLSGVVKLLSGDSSWRDLSALTYHYWTQPLPNPLSPFMNRMPLWFQKISAAGMFAIELGFPFLIFSARTRLWAAVGFVMLSLFIFTTGNYTFFNLLTVALCAWLVPDSMWERLGLPFEVVPADPHLGILPSVAAAVLGFFSLFWCTRWFLPSMVERAVGPVYEWLQPFHLNGPYGLFASMTKTRPEIVIEGSRDGVEWQEYEFRYKPGPVNRMPPIVEPHQPRLDWQMWFAALGSFRQNPWVANLMVRLFDGSPEVLAFFSRNPFADAPPRFLRARLYEYEFGEDTWWTRHLVGEYSPTFERPE